MFVVVVLTPQVNVETPRSTAAWWRDSTSASWTCTSRGAASRVDYGTLAPPSDEGPPTTATTTSTMAGRITQEGLCGAKNNGERLRLAGGRWKLALCRERLLLSMPAHVWTAHRSVEFIHFQKKKGTFQTHPGLNWTEQNLATTKPRWVGLSRQNDKVFTMWMRTFWKTYNPLDTADLAEHIDGLRYSFK